MDFDLIAINAPLRNEIDDKVELFKPNVTVSAKQANEDPPIIQFQNVIAESPLGVQDDFSPIA